MRKYKNLYDYFLSNRELNLDTLKATIIVEDDYHDYLCFLDRFVARGKKRLDEQMDELIAEELIYLIPGNHDSYIEYIEVP